MSLDFNKLLNLPDGGRRLGFEQLLCHLAERNPPLQDTLEFCHIRGDGGDGGLEGYWKLFDGSEIGYQAKFHPVSSDIDWPKIKGSILSALNSHPQIRQIVVSMPRDLTDRVPKRKGKSEREKWEGICVACKAEARKKGIDLEITFWGEAKLENLLALPQSSGLRSYWFGEIELTDEWFIHHQSKSQAALGERYSPDDHVTVDASNVFNGLLRSCSWTDKTNLALQTLNRSIVPPTSKEVKPFLKQYKIVEAKYMVLAERFHDWEKPPQEAIDINWWRDNLRGLCSACEELGSAVYSAIYGEADRRKLGDVIHDIQKMQSTISTFEDCILGQEFEADDKRFALFEGEAGSGKSHLLGAALTDALEAGSPAILIVGSHLNSHSQIENQIASILGINASFWEFLDALNACAERQRTRALICIDAINESNAASEIKAFLQRTLPEFQKRTSISLAISCRSEYTRFFVPPDIKSSSVYSWIEGFVGYQEQEEAAKVYMDRRGIRRPATPWLSKEFTNPLFLRSVCNSLAADGQTAFPVGLRGITNVFLFFITAVSRTLVTRYNGTDELVAPVKRIAKDISEQMASAGRDYVSLSFAKECVEKHFDGKQCESNWLEALQRGGLLRLDPDPDQLSDDLLSPPDEVVRFSFQRFQDYLIARALLNRAKLVQEDFKPDGDLHFIFNNQVLHFRWTGVFSALWTIAAEKFQIELCDILPEDLREKPVFDHYFSEAFVESINWRVPEAFSDRTRKILTEIAPHDRVIQILLNFSVLDHPWNIDFLDQILRVMSLSHRDKIWTKVINDQTRYGNPLSSRLISWCLSPAIIQVSDEVARLALTTMAWFFTSTNKALRDRATKAAIEVLLNKPALHKFYLSHFANVNDPYVIERVLAASAGACLRNPNAERLSDCVEVILNIYDRKSNMPVHLLSRDYVQCIIELEIQETGKKRGIKFLPPYGSEAPCLNLPIERVEKLAEQVGASSILHSCNVHGMGYGDFGRYVLKSRLDDFSNTLLNDTRPNKPDMYRDPAHDLPVDKLASWIILRTLKLGWRKSRFPRDTSHDQNRVSGAKTERIGKKYQWIAYYELLARLADNFWLKDSYREPYAFPYETTKDVPFVRDIEVSLPALPKYDGSNEIFFSSDLDEVPIEKVGYESRDEWVFKKGLASSRITQFRADKAKQALNLYRSASTRIYYPHEDRARMHNLYQEEWFYTWMIGVPSDDLTKFAADTEGLGIDFHDWLPHEHTDVGYVYELGRRKTWPVADMRTEQEGYPNPREFTFRDMVAGFLWESHLDDSIEGSMSVYLPSPWLVDIGGLQQSTQFPGTFRNSSGEGWVDTKKTGHGAKLSTSETWINYILDQYGLSPLWIGFGERSVYPQKKMSGCTRTRWNAVLWQDNQSEFVRTWKKNSRMQEAD